MKIAIYGRPVSRGFEKNITMLFLLLEKHGVEFFIHQPFHEFLVKKQKLSLKNAGVFNTHDDIIGNADIMFSIGGDGTFLEAVSIVQDYGIPIVGINTGRLGFLADISTEHIEASLSAILNRQYKVEQRSLVELELINSELEGFSCALNEVSIQKRYSTMITLHTYLNEKYLNSYWADGLIVSTPTGSTAYSMSVGGPIMSPDSNNFIISPMASHNLTIRPVIVPDNNVIRIEVESRDDSFLLTLDSRTEIIEGNVQLRIKRADFTIKTLRIKDATFYNTLRNKLMWGVDKRN
ncbi:MAG: NAD kinase [Bacteroidales bacterium]|nr:NAD kinase [Bacteroidales bacterium]